MALINPNKKYKKLITFGCSFTQGHLLGETGSWGYQLSKLLGCEHVNKGGGGSSTPSIVQKLLKYCETNDRTECCVGIQWSEKNRREMWEKSTQKYVTFNSVTIEHVDVHNDKEEFVFIKNNLNFFLDTMFDDKENVLRTLNSIILSKNYLISKNINFIMFEGIGSILDVPHKIDKNYDDNTNHINDLFLLDDDFKRELLNDVTFFKKYGAMSPFMLTHKLFENNINDGHPNLSFLIWWVNEMYNYLKENNS
jgi:hypothetical protein